MSPLGYTNLSIESKLCWPNHRDNAAGVVATAPVAFDTFSTNYFTWEAEDFDFNGGQFIDNPVLSTNSVESYYNTVGVTNIDEYVPDYSATQPHLWRTNDEVSTALAGDTPRAQFTAAGIPDYLVGYFNPSNWVNYTRTFPAGTYNIYARLANGNGGLANCDLSEVVSGQDTTNQVTEALGIFQFTGLGWNDFSFVPLTDASGNMLAVKLSGQTTLRVTSGQLGGGVNMNFFMLASGSNTPPAIVNIYPDGLEPFETTNSLSFGVTSGTSTVSQTNVQVTLNGVNLSSQLVFSATSTNWTVSLPLPQQAAYTGTITVTDAAGNSNTRSVSFDNFSQSNFMVNAVDYDFSGGQYIDNPIPTGNVTPSAAYTDPNSYYAWPEGDVGGNAAYTNIDYSTNVQAGFTADYRFLDQAVSTQPATDFLLQNFIANGATEFNLAYWNPGQWFNYTRTYPSNQFHVYGRFCPSWSFQRGDSQPGDLRAGYHHADHQYFGFIRFHGLHRLSRLGVGAVDDQWPDGGHFPGWRGDIAVDRRDGTKCKLSDVCRNHSHGEFDGDDERGQNCDPIPDAERIELHGVFQRQPDEWLGAGWGRDQRYWLEHVCD